MSDLFNICLEKVLKNEGGYSKDPDDKGGETYKGVSRVSFYNWEGWKIIDEYKKDHELKNNDFIDNPELDKMVVDFYYKEFYLPLKIDEIKDPNNALQIFDFAVNTSKVRAVRKAQELTCVHIDGIMGPATISQINNMGHVFADRYIYTRKEYYRYLVKIKPYNIKFLNGWLSRAENTKI
jgi:lysozyme family protein